MNVKNVLASSNSFTALLAALIVFLLSFLSPFNLAERRLLDLAFQLRGTETPHPDIVIIAIDDTSLLKVGNWPWPRSYHAALLKALSDYKPSVIFYDMIFSEKSRPKEDASFAYEIGNARNVSLPFFFTAQEPKEFYRNPTVSPIPSFQSKAASRGYLNVFPDADGHIREIYLKAQDPPETWLHTSLAAAAAHKGISKIDPATLLPNVPYLINFPGPYESFKRIPFDEFLNEHDKLSKKLLKSLEGKVVLVGLTATGTVDLKPTAFSPLYPGIGVQASMVHTLLSRKFIYSLPKWIHFFLLFLIGWLSLRLAFLNNPIRSICYFLAVGIIGFEIRQIFFQFFHLWIPFFSFFVLGSFLMTATLLSQFIRTRFEKEVMTRELGLASRIQKSFLPDEIPSLPGLEISALSLPARQVGGDLYDVIQLEDQLVGICVGDVSGKGVPAALFMAKAISEFRREAHGNSPGRVIRRLNEKMVKEGTSGLFLTLLYLIVDVRNGFFHFASAGHEAIFFYKSRSKTIELVNTQEGTPLGILSEANYEEQKVSAETGDILLLISDGVKEAMNLKREIFGLERINQAFMETSSKSPKEIIDHLLIRIKDFVKTAPQHDDLTVLCVKFT